MPSPRLLAIVSLSLVFSACSAASDPQGTESGSSHPGQTPSDGGGALAGDGSIEGGGSGGNDAAAGGGSGAAPKDGYVVGTQRIEITATGDRRLPVQLWYPAVQSAKAAADQGRPMQDFEPPGEKRDALDALVKAAPDKCTNKTMHAADAPEVFARKGKWPLVVFSHCMDCTRFSMFTVAEHLVSLGFVVAAPDHIGGTVYESKGVLNGAFLKVREGDIKSVLDLLLDDSSMEVPEGLRGKLDAERVAAMGHSYGSVTTGLMAQNDARVKVSVFIAAPPDNPLLSGASVAKLTKPALYIEAMEDHSIQLVGNSILESNYRSHPKSAWLLQVADAGHWSFTDICSLTNTFKPGCGMDTRQNPAQGGSFTYLDIDQARDIGKRYVAAFLSRELLQDSKMGAYLDKGTPADIVTVEHHD